MLSRFTSHSLVFVALLAVGFAALVAPAHARTLTVNTTADTADGACDADCSLREALLAAQSGDTIGFNIPGEGPHVIRPATALPAVGEAVKIDGYTQPGASANGSAQWQVGNASIAIVLDGSGLPGADQAAGIWVAGHNVSVRGLAIVHFYQGVFIGTFASALIAGNYIGIDPGGAAAGNTEAGIRSISGQAGNTIGGPSPADRNVIAGNGGDGIAIKGPAAVFVAGNFIGTDAAGRAAVPNGGAGLLLGGGAESLVGGDEGAGNLVSGNAGDGVVFAGAGAKDINMRGNRIGTTGDGAGPLPNGGHGVFLNQAAHDNTIGGDEPGVQNIIAHNTGAGVALSAAVGQNNYIDPNQTYANGGLGIDLLDNGVTLNDEGDLDSGPNELQNFPLLTRVETTGASVQMSGRLDATPNRLFNLFFFASTECDPSGYGEGQRFLGETTLTTDAEGHADFQRTLLAPVAPGEAITSTASGPESTSEFSACLLAEGALIANGDLDCDFGVDAADALLVLRHAAGLSVSQPAGCPAAGSRYSGLLFGDVDCSGSIDAVDGLTVLRYVAGLPAAGGVAGCPPVGPPAAG